MRSAQKKKKKIDRPPPIPESLNSKSGTFLKPSYILVLIASLAVLAYLPTLENGMVADDEFLTIQDPVVTGQEEFSKIFYRSFLSDSVQNKRAYYRPLITFSYWLDYRLWREQVFGYHLTNIIFHCLSSVLVFWVLLGWTQNFKLSALSGLLFALHPAHTQSVSWISGRTDVICTFFLLLSLSLSLRAQKQEPRIDWKMIILASLCFGLALFAKELAIVFPILLFLSEIFFRTDKGFNLKLSRIISYMMLLIIVLFYLWVRSQVLGSAVGYSLQEPDWYWSGATGLTRNDVSRIATVFKVYDYYLQTLFYPIHLCYESKMFPSLTWTDPALLKSILVAFSVIFLGIFCLKRAPEISFSILWFFIALLPVSNIIPVHELAMEHFLYLPSLGFCLALAWVFVQINERFARSEGKRLKIIFRFSVLIFLGCYFLLTINRHRAWKDNTTLWKDTIWKAPYKHRAHYRLGIAYYLAQKYPLANLSWTRATLLEPGDYLAHFFIADSYRIMGELDQAIIYYQRCLRIKPDFATAHNDLGVALEQRGDLVSAEREYQEAIRLEPSFMLPLENLTRLYLNLGRCKDAERMRVQLGRNASEFFAKEFQEKCGDAKFSR